jgi:Putative carbonic anhydrase
MSEQFIPSPKGSVKRAAPAKGGSDQLLTTNGIADAIAADQPARITNSSSTGFQWSTVELGPDLPMAVFTSTEHWNPQRIGAVAIYCSDGRWGEAFDEFCHQHLQIPRYDRLALAGGPACFAPRDEKARLLCEAALEQITFLVRIHELKRIVLITHYGCAAYTERLQQKAEDCLPSQLEDLRAVSETLQRWFPGIRVEAYLAMRKGSAFSFHAPNA